MIEKMLMKEVLGPIIVIVLSFLIYTILKALIKKLFKLKFKGVDHRKQKTIMLLFINLTKFFIIAISIIWILDIYGFDTKSLIASLGVMAAVVGLALQDLFKDFVAGISIMLEGQYKIGDTVTISGFKGEVISLSLKSTRLKAYTGEIKIFTNRNITEVTNHTLDNSLAIVDVNVAYNSDIEKTEKVLLGLCERLTKELDYLKGPVELLGLNEMKDSAMCFRITADTVSMKHFGIQRQILKEVKIELDKNKIEIPYQQVVVHNGK